MRAIGPPTAIASRGSIIQLHNVLELHGRRVEERGIRAAAGETHVELSWRQAMIAAYSSFRRPARVATEGTSCMSPTPWPEDQMSRHATISSSFSTVKAGTWAPSLQSRRALIKLSFKKLAPMPVTLFV